MNILITAPSLDPHQNISGISTVVTNIVKYNKQHQYYHYLVGRPDRKLNKLIWFYQLVQQLVMFPYALKKNKINLVHQNLPFDPKGVLREYAINLWCRIIGIPVVLHVHGGAFILKGTKSKFFKKLSNSLFYNSKQVIVLSELEKTVLKEKFNFPYAKVLNNCIDTSIYKSSKSYSKSNIPCLLYLGRIEKNKGINELIEALKLLKNDFIFRFILCGTGPLEENCIKAFTEILGNNFEFKGIVYGDSKINVIRQSNIFVLPSYFEGLPIALLETMAAGVVPIVTNVGSMKQIIVSGTNGLLIEKQNPQDLYEKLKIVLSDTELRATLSKNATKTVADQYDVSNYILRLNEIYHSLDVNN